MLKHFRSPVLGIALLAAGAVGMASAQTNTVVVNQNLMNLTQHIGIAFAQTRLSYTSPPFPVQYSDTSPFRAAGPGGHVPNASGVSAATNSATSTNAFFLNRLQRLPPGSYNLTATQATYSITGPVSALNQTIPATVIPYLPPSAVSGNVSVVSLRGGPVSVNYNYQPTR